MKKTILCAFVGFAAWAMTSCNQNTPSEPVQASFPKKNLIEEFTGQDCGYCPYGMNCVHEFVGNDTNWIVVLHHYGYTADNFTVKGSKTITNALNVSGAPNITINRAKAKSGAGKKVVFHPDYLSENFDRNQFETTTYASVKINNTYDNASRELKVTVSGEIGKNDHPTLHLTVLVKESGMVDYQADYYDTYEGWEEFRHVNAVRAFLTEAKGDELTIRNQRYSEEYTLTLNNKWVPENCMVVAFLSEEFQPVVQAEQQPVVSGSKGGADIQYGGITPVAVPDYYPEPNATDGPSAYSGEEADTLSYALAQYTTYSDYGINFWTIMAYNSSKIVKVKNTNCVPFTYLYLMTETSQTAIPAGTYELNNSELAGSAYAGYRDDKYMSIGGCTFYYTGKDYFDQGYLDPYAQWLIVNGTLKIAEDGWELVGHTRNGADIHLVGSTPIKNGGKMSSPSKLPAIDSDLTPTRPLLNNWDFELRK